MKINNDKLKFAQDLIETNNVSIDCGFNMFILGDKYPSYEYYDFSDRMRGYDYAKKMAEEKGIAFTYVFRCECGGYPFNYGGFFVCNTCGGKGVDKEWWKIKVEKDGNMFCCRGLDFINLQESENYAFGETFQESIKNYGELMNEK